VARRFGSIQHALVGIRPTGAGDAPSTGSLAAFGGARGILVERGPCTRRRPTPARKSAALWHHLPF
jgi:hypothetical protein